MVLQPDYFLKEKKKEIRLLSLIASISVQGHGPTVMQRKVIEIISKINYVLGLINWKLIWCYEDLKKKKSSIFCFMGARYKRWPILESKVKNWNEMHSQCRCSVWVESTRHLRRCDRSCFARWRLAYVFGGRYAPDLIDLDSSLVVPII